MVMSADVKQVLAAVDARPTVAAYCSAARELASAPQLQGIRVALLASFTIEPLKPLLQVEAARLGFWPDVYIARFNTVRQELLDPASGCAAYKPTVVFIAEMLNDVCPQLGTQWTGSSAADVDAVIEATVDALVASIAAFRAHCNATVVVHNYVPPRHPAMGVYDTMAEVSQLDAIARLNRRLATGVATIPGAYVLDTSAVAARTGLDAWYDDRMWCLARTPMTTAAFIALASVQATFIALSQRPPRKVLALDLDNTLWGGVIGEAGIDGISLGEDYPGNAFVAFQQYVLHLHQRGVLLALLSKNNQEEVDAVFASHRSMLLKPGHFAATRVNWQPKATNLLSIAEELSLSTDAFVFFDDDSAECEWMRAALPDVLTVQAPPDVTQFTDALVRTRAFERLTLTEEDRQRGRLYTERRARHAAEVSATSVDEFLQGLDMIAVIEPVDDRTAHRAAALLSKTNQFNLTTRRHSIVEVDRMRHDRAHGCFTLQLQDRFGNHGIVGIAIVRRESSDPRRATIDSLLLSCRVIGRRAETALLAHVVDWARQQGCETVIGEFRATAKNQPAAECYSRHGFRRANDDGTAWLFDLASQQLESPSCIRLASPAVVS
jgi:FkbH-like protein